MQWLAMCVLLRFHSFLFSILCCAILGTGDVRPADMLFYEVLRTHFGECYVVSVVGFDVSHVCR